MPVRFDLHMKCGDSFARTLRYKDKNGVIVSLSGSTLILTLLAAPRTITPITFTKLGDTTGEMPLLLTPEQTRFFKPGASWKLQRVIGTFRKTLVEGAVIPEPEF